MKKKEKNEKKQTKIQKRKVAQISLLLLLKRSSTTRKNNAAQISLLSLLKRSSNPRCEKDERTTNEEDERTNDEQGGRTRKTNGDLICKMLLRGAAAAGG